ncbi:uncharacterized protein LOC132734095 [Ruditapes philippinarum]|uniref:uncharacterized protein LOC132734095 n=1 Tax=Ruditapes philippinarum TaxID=129788 RepID=UPI00295B25F9|nr:uncharacterized protein LOC132734095 [Ruditapes philippinarum]
MEPVSKKLKVEDNCSEPFTQKGSHDDEVTLAFGKEKLYVSKNFLCLASPVFEAMFRNECREKKEKLVQMIGKSYEDFIDFLLCIHPRILKEVNELIVLRIVPFAEEYQVTSIVTKCKAVIKSMLLKAEKNASNVCISVTQLKPLKKCLNILQSAISLNYTDITALAIKSIARFGYCLYDGLDQSKDFFSRTYPALDNKIDYTKETTYGDLYRECGVLFKGLSLDIRFKILSERLIKVSDNNFK